MGMFIEERYIKLSNICIYMICIRMERRKRFSNLLGIRMDNRYTRVCDPEINNDELGAYLSTDGYMEPFPVGVITGTWKYGPYQQE